MAATASSPPDLLNSVQGPGAGGWAWLLYEWARVPSTQVTLEGLDSALQETSEAVPTSLSCHDEPPRGPVWSAPLAFSKSSDYTRAARPHGVGAVGGAGGGAQDACREEMDVGEGQGQPGPHGQPGTVSAGESWLPTTLQAFAVAALAPTGPRTAHLHPLASNSLLLLTAWLPGFTVPPQSTPANILTLLHPNSSHSPNSPRPITSLLLSALLSSSGPILLVSTSPMPFYHLAIATPSPPSHQVPKYKMEAARLFSQGCGKAPAQDLSPCRGSKGIGSV